jgi:hypothetical protein
MGYFIGENTPATKINATVITKTDGAVYLDCEGDKEWFPLSTVELDEENGTVLIADWKYRDVFGENM